MSPLTYALCTLDGIINRLTIDLETQSTHAENIHCNIDFNKYALYGISISRNHAFWLLALFPCQVKIHGFILKRAKFICMNCLAVGSLDFTTTIMHLSVCKFDGKYLEHVRIESIIVFDYV